MNCAKRCDQNKFTRAMTRKAPPHAWKAGQSGNPSGKPKMNVELRQACRDMTAEVLEALRGRLHTAKDAVAAANLILAYGYGRPVQNVNARVIRSMGDLSDEELQAIIAAGDAETQSESVH
jgi:hypothetical protein